MANKYVTSGANVGFLTGTQASINELISGVDSTGAATTKVVKHGYFYLTTDTHRLYVGNEDLTLSPVNEGITFVTYLTGLDTPSADNAGQFFYVAKDNATNNKDLNVLCVSNGSYWVQINSNTDSYVSGNTVKLTTDLTNNKVEVKQTLTNTDSGNSVFLEDNSKLTVDLKYDVKGANGVSITSSDIVYDTDGKTVKENAKITITGDTYTLGHGTNTDGDVLVKLDSTNTTNDSTVKLIAGSNVTITDTTDGIKISSTGGGSSSSSGGTVSDATFLTGSVEKTVDGTKTTVNEGFKIKIDNSDGTNVMSNVYNPTITYGDTATTIHLVNDTFNLPVYSKSDIDTKLQGLNAMVFKGTVGDSSSTYATYAALKTALDISDDTTSTTDTKVSNGDTFKLTSDQTINGTTVKSGSVIIATGTENSSTGYIPNNALTWSVVTGMDTDTGLTVSSFATTTTAADNVGHWQTNLKGTYPDSTSYNGSVSSRLTSDTLTVSTKSVTSGSDSVTAVSVDMKWSSF